MGDLQGGGRNFGPGPEVTLEEDLVAMEVVVDLGMAAMGVEEDLEEIIMEVEIIMILEIIISNLLTMVQWRVEILVVAGTWGDHMVAETIVLEEVEEVGVMEREADIKFLPICHGLHTV